MRTGCLLVVSTGPTPWKNAAAREFYLIIFRAPATVQMLISNKKAMVWLERYKSQNTFLW